MKKMLKLDDFIIKKLHVDWFSKEESPHLPKENPYIDFDISRNIDNKRQYSVRLMVSSYAESSDKSKILISVDIIGFFTFYEDATEEEMNNTISLNGLIILYGLIRGQLASSTGAFPCGKYLLPSVYMEEIIPKVIERKKKKPKKRKSK